MGYENSNSQWNGVSLEVLLVVAGGDLNGHHPLWDSIIIQANSQGRSLVEVFTKTGLKVLNKPDSLPTFYSSVGGSYVPKLWD